MLYRNIYGSVAVVFRSSLLAHAAWQRLMAAAALGALLWVAIAWANALP